MRTTTKVWDDYYKKLGDINLLNPTDSAVIRQTMGPHTYAGQARLIAWKFFATPTIIEIGCGYGGLASEIRKCVNANFLLVDNKAMLDHARQFLGETTEYVEPKDIKLLADRKFDIFISNSCLSETPAAYREYVLENIAPNCRYLFMIEMSDGTKPTRRMLEVGYEIESLDIKARLEKYFTIEATLLRKNRYQYIGERKYCY